MIYWLLNFWDIYFIHPSMKYISQYSKACVCICSGSNGVLPWTSQTALHRFPPTFMWWMRVLCMRGRDWSFLLLILTTGNYSTEVGWREIVRLLKSLQRLGAAAVLKEARNTNNGKFEFPCFLPWWCLWQSEAVWGQSKVAPLGNVKELMCYVLALLCGGWTDGVISLQRWRTVVLLG